MKTSEAVYAKVANLNDMQRFLKQLKIRGKGFVIKPNWSNANMFTSAKTLDLLLSCLDGDKTVIEGYTAWRNRLNTGTEPQDFITPRNAKTKWRWIKEQDTWFLKYSGVEAVLIKHRVEYVNVTEEVWSGRAVAKEKVKRIVERKFEPVRNEEIYSFVPEKIYNLRDRALISVNLSRKTREMMSLSTKNLFGLIPDPARYGKWHGENDTLLPQSIVDINKAYRCLFKPCFWINEIRDRSLLVGSENSVLADAITAKIIGVNPKRIEYLQLASKVFGGYEETSITKSLKELELA